MAKLTPAEQQLCDAISEGRVAAFANYEAIAAETIRRIALSIAPAGQSGPVACPAGVRIKGGTIMGRLDLAYAGQGGSTPVIMSLQDCLLKGGIDASHATLAALSLNNCRFSEEPFRPDVNAAAPPIDLSDAHICGTLDLSGIAPLGKRDYCYLRAEGAQIDGNLELARAILRAPAMQPDRPYDDSGTAALDLSLARIDGDLNMTCSPEVTGAVRMRCTDLSGDLWICGAQFLRAECLRDGTIVPPEADIDDCLFMQSVNIGGSVNIYGSALNRDGSEKSQPVRFYGDVSLRLAHVGEGLSLIGCRFGGSLRLEGASIGKSAYLVSGGYTEARARKEIAASDMSVQGDLVIGLPVDGFLSLQDAEIGGSLDLSLLDLPKSFLWLRSARIERSLRITNTNVRSIQSSRSKQLACLAGLTLVETFSQDTQGGTRPVQAAFLVRGKEFWRLEGKSELLHALIERFGHRINSPEAAEEYVRLFCNYLEGDEGYFRLLAPADDTPLGLKLDETRLAGALAEARQIVNGCHRNRAVQLLEAALHDSDLDVLAQSSLRLRCVYSYGALFRFSGAIIYGGEIFRCLLDVDANQPDAVKVQMVCDEPTGLIVLNPPRVGTVFVEPGGDMADMQLPGGFVTAPTVAGMVPTNFGIGAVKLLPQIQSGFLVRGLVNLSETRCGMLDDLSGLAWGENARIDSNHFEYGRTNWDQSAVLDAARRVRSYSILADDASVLEHARHRVSRFARSLTDAAMRTLGGEARSRLSGFDAEWEHRNHWLRRQFMRPVERAPGVVRQLLRGSSGEAHLVPDKASYKAQTYEQIIAVARAEGREEFAVRFEIEKRDIEAGLRSRKMRLLTSTLGVVAALAAGLLTLRNDLVGDVGGAPASLLVALVTFLVVTYFLDIANVIMRRCFGYLMRPFNAMMTLVTLFLLGWWGVSLANSQRMMVIDFDPVASVAYAEGDSVEIGSGPGDQVLSNIRCGGEINEALYALDVLIPLIDLRQEEKCEVGLATVPQAEVRAEDRTGLWSFAKAAYAILGWIVVSLVILTFVNTFRTKSEN